MTDPGCLCPGSSRGGPGHRHGRDASGGPGRETGAWLAADARLPHSAFAPRLVTAGTVLDTVLLIVAAACVELPAGRYLCGRQLHSAV